MATNKKTNTLIGTGPAPQPEADAVTLLIEIRDLLKAGQNEVIAAQSARIRDLVSENVKLSNFIREAIDADNYGPEDWERWNTRAKEMTT